MISSRGLGLPCARGMLHPTCHDRSAPTPSRPTDKLPELRARARRGTTSPPGKNGGKVMTRFPPEPNGYLHIGHAKSICLNFGIAQAIPGAACNLRFDDTNPSTEEDEFVRSIQEDVRWLGFDWGEPPLLRVGLLREALRDRRAARRGGQGLRRQPDARGDARGPRQLLPAGPREPVPRPHASTRTSTCSAACAPGEFPDGAHVLRAKIDMQSPNQNLRDPVMYRIKREHHHRTGDAWCIYPMYDFAHGYSRRHRGRDALDLHARVREPPAALRLVSRADARVRPAPAADRVRAPEPDVHDAVEAQAEAARRGRARDAAGTIRGCRRSRACGGAGTRPRRSARSASASASRSATASSTSRCSSTRCART